MQRRERKPNPYIYPGVWYEEWRQTIYAKREIADDNSFTQMDLKILKKLNKNHISKNMPHHIYDDAGKLKKVSYEEYLDHAKDTFFGAAIRTWFCEINKEITPKILHDFLRSLTPERFATTVYSDEFFPDYYERKLGLSPTEDEIIDYWEKLEEWFEYCYYMEQFHKDSIYFGWIIDGI